MDKFPFGAGLHFKMEAISALAAYGSGSSDSEPDNEDRTEEYSLHLKPVAKEQQEVSIGKEIAVTSAPAVITKVRIYCVCLNRRRFVWICTCAWLVKVMRMLRAHSLYYQRVAKQVQVD